MTISEKPSWIEVAVTVPTEWHELVAEALCWGPCAAVSMEDAPTDGSPPSAWTTVRTHVPEHEDSPKRRAWFQQRLDLLADRAEVPELMHASLTFRRIEDRDWESSWMETTRPFRIGRLCIVPPHRATRRRPEDVLLVLTPGGAFGTGQHATTRACLRAIQRQVRPGDRVLDAGCGSGVLSVALALFGAGHVFGFDIDPAAVPYATSLAKDNGVETVCRFENGSFDVLDGVAPFDGVAANLYGDLLVERAASFRTLLHHDGWFSLSGCSRERAPAVRRALEAVRLNVEWETQRGRWYAFHGRALS